ncbi:MAG: hypothetical protein IKR64_03125, partial [Treponema sp.]|nr:hypothetical protein [Treponema sp.]
DQKQEKSENIEIFFQAQTPLFSLKKSDEADIIPEPEEEVATEEVAAKEEVAAEAELEEISEAEEIPEAPYFAMTQFGQNEEPVIELRGDGETIIEQDGVYSIADNLSYTKVFLNQEFKMLVDSVLQK